MHSAGWLVGLTQVTSLLADSELPLRSAGPMRARPLLGNDDGRRWTALEGLQKDKDLKSEASRSWRFDPESENEAETAKGVQEGFLGRIAAAPAVGRARLYRVNERVSTIPTEEQKVYGSSPKRRPHFLALVEMASAPPPENEAWRDLFRQDLQTARVGLRMSVKRAIGCIS